MGKALEEFQEYLEDSLQKFWKQSVEDFLDEFLKKAQ